MWPAYKASEDYPNNYSDNYINTKNAFPNILFTLPNNPVEGGLMSIFFLHD